MDDFLSEARREEVLSALRALGCQEPGGWRELTDVEVENFRRLLRDSSVAGRVISCHCRVKFLELRDFCRFSGMRCNTLDRICEAGALYSGCRELHLFIVETWPWVLFGESLHRCQCYLC